MRYFVWIGILILSSACGKVRHGELFDYDKSVPGDQSDLLERDVKILQQLQIDSTTGADIYGTSNMSAPTLTGWLKQRTKAIVGEDFNLEERLDIAASGHNYSPAVFTLLDVVTVMSNLGGALYLTGKEKQALLALDVAGQRVTVDTPRVGIFKIGEGLFQDRLKSGDLTTMGYSCLRLGTLFHEARHSDGNGTNAGFPHTKCPSTVRGFSGEYACESNTNGPYVIGRVFLERCIEACTQCSSSEVTALQASVQDYKTRVLENPQTPDPRPERTSW